MARGKKTGGRDFVKGDPRRKTNPRKGTGIPEDLVEACKARTPQALAYLERAIRQTKITSSGIAAALAILERGWGKVPQQVEGNIEGRSEHIVRIEVVRADKLAANVSRISAEVTDAGN